MFQSPRLGVRAAAGRSEPLLWVRRLVLWSAPGVLLHEITLRRGLNVIWSPDPADTGAETEAEPVAPLRAALGHGAGKTLFCRLLRYCLGEATYGTVDQRAKIARAYPDGRVGAEIVVAGTTWSVVRSLGLFPNDRVVRGVPIERIDEQGNPDAEELDLAAFVEAVQLAVIGKETAALIAKAPGKAWLTALAWLSRDQECRLAKITAWRSPSAGAGSPAEALSSAEASRVVRALLGASHDRERAEGAKTTKLLAQRRKQETEAEHHRWAFRRRLAQLAVTAGLDPKAVPEGPLAIDALRTAALARQAAFDAAHPPATLPSHCDHCAAPLAGTNAATTRKLLDDIAELGAQLTETEAALADVAATVQSLDRARDRAAATRDESARALARLRSQFEAVVRRILGDRASATLGLDHNGLTLALQLGGDQTSPGIESLKILAFDLAVLCQSIEGGTQLPAFLIHDSPREADLGLSLYHPVFELARELERTGPPGSEAPFQYIVTTTTLPPAFARVEPVLRLELHGAPAEARLLKTNL
jgi:hypothetical protein